METAIPDSLLNYWPYMVAIGALTLLGAVIRSVQGAWDFHYNYFTRRHLKRMVELLPLVIPGSPQHKYLREVIDSEIFKIAAGTKVSSQKAAALMSLCEQGLLSANKVKKMAPFVFPTDEGGVRIRIQLFDKIFMGYALVCAVLIFCYGFYSFSRLAYIGATTNTVLPTAVGVMLFLGCAFVVGIFKNDVLRYRAAQNIKFKLKARASSQQSPE